MPLWGDQLWCPTQQLFLRGVDVESLRVSFHVWGLGALPRNNRNVTRNTLRPLGPGPSTSLPYIHPRQNNPKIKNGVNEIIKPSKRIHYMCGRWLRYTSNTTTAFVSSSWMQMDFRSGGGGTQHGSFKIAEARRW